MQHVDRPIERGDAVHPLAGRIRIASGPEVSDQLTHLFVDHVFEAKARLAPLPATSSSLWTTPHAHADVDNPSTVLRPEST